MLSFMKLHICVCTLCAKVIALFTDFLNVLYKTFTIYIVLSLTL